MKIQSSERAFATLAQRSLSDGSSPLRAALQDGGLVASAVALWVALLSPRLFKWMCLAHWRQCECEQDVRSSSSRGVLPR